MTPLLPVAVNGELLRRDEPSMLEPTPGHAFSQALFVVRERRGTERRGGEVPRGAAEALRLMGVL